MDGNCSCQQKFNAITEIVAEAMAWNTPLTFSCILGRQLVKVTGYVHYYDLSLLQFRLVALNNSVTYRIPLQSILDVVEHKGEEREKHILLFVPSRRL